MRWIGLTAILISLLVVGCDNEINSGELEPTQRSSSQGPLVSSNTERAIVVAWEYISPLAENALTEFPSPNSEAIEFGSGTTPQAYILWHEDGFDLMWGGFICSTQPVVIINEATIELWPNDVIWDFCESMLTGHMFKVKLETSIPLKEWSYIVHPGEDLPPKNE